MRRLLMLASLLALAGCAAPGYRPYTYTGIGDMRPGAGLFTGSAGEVTVYSRDTPLGP